MKENLKREAEERRLALMAEMDGTDAEIARHVTTLEAEQERARAEEAERAKLQEEIGALEGKIMHGGEHVKDRVARRDAELDERRRQLEEQRAREVILRQQAAQKEEEKLAQDEKYSSLQEEAASKSRKLKQLWAKFKAAQAEIDDLQMEQQQEKEDLLHTVRELTRQVQLQNMVIEAFVPNEEVTKLERRALWEEDSGTWRLTALSEARDKESEARPKSHESLLRPTCFIARKMAADLTNNEPRYRAINVLSFDLDMPERTTADYDADVNPNVRAALSAALKDDEEIAVEAEENLPTMGVGGNGWMPGMEAAGGGGGALGRVGAGMSAAMTAAKLAGRAKGGADGARRRAEKKKASSSSRRGDDDLDALLSGTASAAPPASAEEQFPTSRGLIGSRRMR